MRHDLFRFSGHHIPEAAVLICRVGRGTHTGIIYRNESGGLSVLEFFLGGEIVSRPWDGNNPHVVLPGEDDDALKNLASLCRVIAQRYRQNPPKHLYGFKRSRDARILKNGELYLGDAIGATCASFVLIVLFTAGIELVVEGEEWPHRPGVDDPKHEVLLALLAKHYPDPANLTRVQAELPCPRVAPEKVAGAVMWCPSGGSRS